MGSDNKPELMRQQTVSGGVMSPSGGTMPKWEDEDTTGVVKPAFGIIGMCLVMQIIGVAISWGVFKFGAHAVYCTQIKALATAGGHWTYAGLVLVAFGIRFVNLYPMTYKEKVMKGALRDELGANMRSNPFIYKSVGPSSETVLYQNDGVTGKYNRANRSLTHMIENFGSMLAGLMLTGSIFPLPTFVMCAGFAIGRMVHQVGYASGYGAHGLGFMITTLSCLALEGLCVLVFLGGCGMLSLDAALPPAPSPYEARIAALEASIASFKADA